METSIYPPCDLLIADCSGEDTISLLTYFNNNIRN